MMKPAFFWNGITRSAELKDKQQILKLFALLKSKNWQAFLNDLSKLGKSELEFTLNIAELDSQEWNTPLHYAASLGADANIIKKMTELGALRSIRNKLNQTPRELAIQQGHASLLTDLEPIFTLKVMRETLQSIEANFHDYISNNQDAAISKLVRDKSMRLPQLEPLLELEFPRGWFQIPGYYGGINYRLRLDDNQLRLICAASSRIVDGSFQLWEITSEGKHPITANDENSLFLLSMKLLET